MPRILLQTLFTLLYTRFAWAYNYVAWLASAGYWYRWVNVCLPYIQEGKVLELGCGRGYLLKEITAKGYEVIGVDYAEEMCHYAHAQSGQPVLRADGRTLPFPDGTFQTVITTFPAPYIAEESTQRELARLVKEGGQWLWVDVPMLNLGGDTWLSWLVNRLTYGVVPPIPPMFARDATGGLWNVTIERVVVGNTSIAVRRARKRF